MKVSKVKTEFKTAYTALSMMVSKGKLAVAGGMCSVVRDNLANVPDADDTDDLEDIKPMTPIELAHLVMVEACKTAYARPCPESKKAAIEALDKLELLCDAT